MKYLIFIRGDPSTIRYDVVEKTLAYLNPNLDTIRAIKTSMADYGNDPALRKSYASSVKRLVKKVLSGHEEQFIIIDNPNTNPKDWMSMLGIADTMNVPVLGIGINISPNEQVYNGEDLNEQDPNLIMFKSTMYKYIDVKSDQELNTADIEAVIDELTNE